MQTGSGACEELVTAVDFCIIDSIHSFSLTDSDYQSGGFTWNCLPELEVGHIFNGTAEPRLRENLKDVLLIGQKKQLVW